MKRTWLLTVITVLLLVVLGCRFNVPKVKPMIEDAQELIEDAEVIIDQGKELIEEATQDDDAQDESTQPEDDQQDDESALNYDSDALEKLDSYRSTLVTRYEAADGTVDETRVETAVTRDPAAQHLTMGSNDEVIEMIEIGDQMWMKFGEEWMQSSAAEGSSIADDFGASLIAGDEIADLKTSDYEYLGKETLDDGTRTRHFRAKYTKFWGFLAGQGDDVDWEDGNVDVWIADESDLPKIVVKMEYRLEGKVDDQDVTFILSQSVTDLNEPFTIEPPSADEVGGLPDDVPLYPEASEVTTMAGMTVFTTADSIEDVAAFYEDNLGTAGWERTAHTDMEAMVTSTWEKDGQSLQLTITPGDDDGGSSVMILVSEE